MTDRKKNLVILGATGSIGVNAVEVCRAMPRQIHLFGMAADQSWTELAKLAAANDCREVVIGQSQFEEKLRNTLPAPYRVSSGEQAIIELCTNPEVDIVLCAITGTGGLKPVMAAIEHGKDIALASKEILVAAGQMVMTSAHRREVRILPVDSEHSAIFQCLQGEDKQSVKRLILTASGGPFRTSTREHLRNVSYQQALAHPTWRMGAKITIDSATLMNKGLELIEAHWLFDMPLTDIEVILHPQSIIHSMVEMIDGSILAQLGEPDMRLPIQYALGFPRRTGLAFSPLNFMKQTKMEFCPPPGHLRPALALARRAGETGGTMPAVFNAANEIAVEAFRNGLISFLDIAGLVEKTMDSHQAVAVDDLETVLQADAQARSEARQACGLI